MSKKQSIDAPVGGNSLLVIFAVLCLTVFALLTLSTVQADSRMENESVKATIRYYEADSMATSIIGRLKDGDTIDDIQSDYDSVHIEEHDGRYLFTCPVSETQELSVRVLINDEVITIEEYMLVSTVEFNPDENMELWDGSVDEESEE